MTDHIPLLIAIGMSSAAVGGVTYALAGAATLRRRAAALTLVAYGTLASAAATFFVLALHFHSPTTVHLHNSLAQLHAGLLDDRTVAVLALAVVVFASAFLINQGLARGLVRSCHRREDEDLTSRTRTALREPAPFRLIVVSNPEPDAFAFAVLRRRGMGLAAEDVVVVTKGLVDLLPPDELRAAIAHEEAHVHYGDGRYLPFFRTLSSVVFFDPLVRTMQGRLFRRSELRADEEAAWKTREPLALARALARLLLRDSPHRGAAGFLGGGPSLLVRRIERLMELDRLWRADT